MSNQELLDIVNFGLAEGKTVTQIGRELNMSESAIRKRLNRMGYKREGNRFIAENNTTGITTAKKVKVEGVEKSSVVKENTNAHIIQDDRLMMLLDNLDKLLMLIPKETINNDIRSNKKEVTSLRLDTGIYNAVKQRAAEKNIKISEILERALIDYLNRYL